MDICYINRSGVYLLLTELVRKEEATEEEETEEEE